MRVLYLDDDVTFAADLADALEGRGHDVTFVHSYDTAEAAAGADFDVVISDYDLHDPAGRTGATFLDELADGPSKFLISGLRRDVADDVTFVPKHRIVKLLDHVDAA